MKKETMTFNEKIMVLLNQTKEDNERFDFKAMEAYIKGTNSLENASKFPVMNYMPAAQALYYAEKKLRPAIIDIFESNNINIDDNIEKQINKQVNECWQEGFPLFYWRKEKVCYQFNKSLAHALLEQIDLKSYSIPIPAQILKKIPYKSAFVSTEGNVFEKGYTSYTYGGEEFEVIGFVYVIIRSMDDNSSLVDICPVVTKNGRFEVMENYYLNLPDSEEIDINEAVDRVYKHYLNQEDGYIKNIENFGGFPMIAALQYLLYLCSEDADVQQFQSNIPIYRKPDENNIKDKYREVLQLSVGEKVGAILTQNETESKLFGVDVHLRRAHWHHRWVGKVSSNERRLILQWQGPSIVRRKYKAWSELGKDVVEAEDAADHKLEMEISENNGNNKEIETVRSPLPKPQKPNGSSRSYAYPRNKMVAINAILKAQYKCEFDQEHETFIRKSDKTPYVEPHHIVPMAFQDDFEVNLDREQNIIVLCCNCHKRIHFGIRPNDMLKKIYMQRKDQLKEIGIDISLEDLIQMYS